MLNNFVEYLHARRRSPATIRVRLVYLNQLAEAHPDLSTVQLIDLETIIAAHRHNWKPETVNAAISSWRVFYKWAHRRGLVDHDPTEFLELVYVPKKVKRLADDNAIRAALPTATLRDQAMLLLGREAGLRRTEIATLHTEHRHGTWLHVTGKGDRTRKVKAGPTLLDVLLHLEHAQGPGYYFPSTRREGHIAPESVYRTVVRNIGTSTHSLRRSALTNVYRNSGKDIRLTQMFAGHANPATTADYIDVEDDDLARAADYASIA